MPQYNVYRIVSVCKLGEGKDVSCVVSHCTYFRLAFSNYRVEISVFEVFSVLNMVRVLRTHIFLISTFFCSLFNRKTWGLKRYRIRLMDINKTTGHGESIKPAYPYHDL